MKSIKRKIVIFVFSGMLLTNFFVGYYVYHDTREEVEELFNAEQAQLARVIDSILERGLVPGNEESLITEVPSIANDVPSAVGHHYEEKLAFQVWDHQGNLWMMSRNAPLYPLTAQTPGFSEVNYDNSNWHVFALYSSSTNSWIYTAQLDEVREELIELIVMDQIIPSLLATLIVLIVVVAAVYFGARDIVRFSTEVAARGSHDLSPIDIRLPEELLPIRKSINELMQHIQDAFRREQSFNADAAHELRTPLSALRVHAQNIELSGRLDKDATNAMKKILLSIDKMSQTVEQLLLLNRLDGHKFYSLEDEVDLHAISVEVISELAPDILSKYEFSVEGVSVVVKGNHNLLVNLLRNLVENAYKYSPENTPIQIRTFAENDLAVLEVEDSGPGLSDEQKENVTQRFYRISDRQNYGTGLGLSIVKRIIELHSGRLDLLDAPSGNGLLCKLGFNVSA